MNIRFLKRRFAKIRRRIFGKDRAQRVLIAGGIVLLIGMVISPSDPLNIDPAAYTPLLNTIAKGESGGNYNAYFGNAANSDVRFTDMTVEQVFEWQDDYVAQGNVSNAVGRYQIIKPTLEGLVGDLGVESSEKFDKNLQDRLAIALLERRGAHEYVNNKLSEQQFAANLAKEWAALPKATGPNPDESYYGGDGINKSNTSISEVYSALGELQAAAKKD